MGIFGKPRTIRKFVERAAQGPANCRIDISRIADLYDAFINYPVSALFSLEERGLAHPTDVPRDSIGLLCSKSLGVCPKCHIVTNGDWLLHMHLVKGSSVSSALMSKDYARFLTGKCRNPNCDCKDILIFWRPHESKKLTNDLAKMGIEI